MSVTLTTIDNPFHPFNEYELWSNFDKMHGYNSSELLDRFVRVADCLSEADQELAYEEAVDHIVESEWLNPLGVYVKFKETPPSMDSNTPPNKSFKVPPSDKNNPTSNKKENSINDFEDSESFYKNFKEELKFIQNHDNSF